MKILFRKYKKQLIIAQEKLNQNKIIRIKHALLRTRIITIKMN